MEKSNSTIMTMKQYLLTFLFLALSVPGSIVRAELPDSFNANYALHYDDLRIGVMEREFSRDPENANAGTFTSKSKLTGLAAFFKKDKLTEISQWELVNGMLRPVEYSYEKFKEEGVKKENHRFDWKNKTVVSTTNDGETEQVLEEGMLDKLLYQLAVMNTDEISNDLDYRIVDKHQIKTYEFEFLGEEDLKTPMGSLKTLKFQRKVEDSKKSTTLWCAPSLHNLPVRVDVTNAKGHFTSIIIENETGLNKAD